MVHLSNSYWICVSERGTFLCCFFFNAHFTKFRPPPLSFLPQCLQPYLYRHHCFRGEKLLPLIHCASCLFPPLHNAVWDCVLLLILSLWKPAKCYLKGGWTKATRVTGLRWMEDGRWKFLSPRLSSCRLIRTHNGKTSSGRQHLNHFFPQQFIKMDVSVPQVIHHLHEYLSLSYLASFFYPESSLRRLSTLTCFCQNVHLKMSSAYMMCVILESITPIYEKKSHFLSYIGPSRGFWSSVKNH